MKDENLTVFSFTGFDTASPCFEFEGRSLHINSSDANSVILVHSNMGNFGTTRLSGTVDFCPNGGRDQPYDCEHWTHMFALVAHKFDYTKYGDCQPVAYQCESYDEFLKGRCGSCDNVIFTALQNYAT
ncbi:lipase member I-like protein [Dinothrombium tinctorium]|uniref:Lipase member I-like protein n=1 Tax=Dinothrombium tinctorium TaxID=1965070 RepID=A0A443RIM4_9ACAR|nr:lipase member I-like protein [Dinothrombium tinctorium]